MFIRPTNMLLGSQRLHESLAVFLPKKQNTSLMLKLCFRLLTPSFRRAQRNSRPSKPNSIRTSSMRWRASLHIIRQPVWRLPADILDLRTSINAHFGSRYSDYSWGWRIGAGPLAEPLGSQTSLGAPRYSKRLG